MSHTNFHRYFIFYFIIFGIVLSFFGSLCNYFIQLDYKDERIARNADSLVHHKIEYILKPIVKNIDNLVLSLGNNENIKHLLEGKCRSEMLNEEIQKIFLAFANANNKLMKIRLIDNNGDEKVRVDRLNETTQPFIVANLNLQNRKDSEYFLAVSSMSSQQLWHSKIDFNIENGKIEMPYRPTFRVAIPFFVQDKFIGMVIVNLLTNELCDSMKFSPFFSIYLIDKDYNFIIHPNENLSLHKYKNVQVDFKIDFPDGLDGENVYKHSIDTILQNDDDAILILKPKQHYQVLITDEYLQTAFYVAMLTIVLSFILGFYISKKPIQLQKALIKAYAKLDEFHRVIDKYVISARTKPDSTFISVSSAFLESSGYTEEELIGKQMNIIRHPAVDTNIYKELWETILTGKTWHGIIQNKNKKGETYWLDQYIVPMTDEENKVISFISIGIDVTKKIEAEKLAFTDGLTQIYNRRMIDSLLTKEIEIAKRHSKQLCVIMFDIDHFKLVNDIYGHDIGDVVLIETTKIVSENLRKSDIFGRYGGEEFLIVCIQSNIQDSFKLAEKLRLKIESHIFEKVGTKTVSLGIAILSSEDDMKSLVHKADMALYKAKNGGRNQTGVYQ